MSEPMDRRKTLQAIAASSIGLAMGTQPAIAQQKPAPVRITTLQGVLAKEWDTLEYTYEGAPALLLRIPRIYKPPYPNQALQLCLEHEPPCLPIGRP
ncbi:hypothetical protein [Meiothermus hypogaeus]|uniref:Uncharacterized protein n=2 Tax=Meiothermus hypogaeus TaxID=884155 RepID=A0ABX9MJB7_9DEIN|nr:hypothetical protein [Meiothermus hypogaeus]RIH74248.1 hypothetical protein Mhypo_03443 [Meiothermus hypogaeus]